jgi:hypothetical protein
MSVSLWLTRKTGSDLLPSYCNQFVKSVGSEKSNSASPDASRWGNANTWTWASMVAGRMPMRRASLPRMSDRALNPQVKALG